MNPWGRSAGLALWICAAMIASCAPRPDTTVSPVPFSHRQHVEKKLACTFCHIGAVRNARAGMPGVKLCMSCHSEVKASSPGVLQAKAYMDRREEIDWPRRYAPEPEANVFFNHRRHAAVQVPCSTCHGEVAKAGSKVPVLRWTMEACVRCHVENKAMFRDARLADDCVTCHR